MTRRFHLSLLALLAVFAMSFAACEAKEESKEEKAEESAEGEGAAAEGEGAAAEGEGAAAEGDGAAAEGEGAAAEGDGAAAEGEAGSDGAGEATAGTAPAAGDQKALRDPTLATETAPESYKVKLATTKGDIIVQVTRKLSPAGADRFYNLVRVGYFQDIAFFRVLDGFVAQFGMHADPEINAIWSAAMIDDDPVAEKNTRGMLVFATAGPNTRSNQFFINTNDNSGSLDPRGFSPFGEVVEGMDVVDGLYKEYGEGAPRGAGPDQQLIGDQGNAYLKEKFPKLDYIESATIVE